VKRTRLIETSVGLFAVIGTVLLVSIFFVLMGKEHAFERRFSLVAIFDNVSGLKPGAAVQLAGIDVGSVGSVQFNEENRADVLLEIRDTFRGRVYKDAVASIATMGLLGDKIIILTSGARRAGSVEDGDVISTESYIELTDVMDEVGPALQNVKEILDSMSGFFSSLDAPVNELEKVLGSAGQIAEQLQAGEGTAGAILRDPQLYSKLVALIENADGTVKELKEVAVDLRAASKELPELSASARATMAKMSELVDSGKDVVDNAKLASKNFPELVDRTNRVAENLEAITDNVKVASTGLPDLITTGHEGVEQGLELVEAARKSWVVRGYLDRSTRHEPAAHTLRDTNYSEGSEK
jgi:phospholipid/cholesterol/gamma-HCH transport system substrate-binding protein